MFEVKLKFKDWNEAKRLYDVLISERQFIDESERKALVAAMLQLEDTLVDTMDKETENDEDM